MLSLTPSFKVQLRGRAMQLPASVIVGKAGVTPPVVAEMEKQLLQRDLIKVKWSARDKAARAELLHQLEELTSAQCVGQVGHTASFYRPLPKSSE